MDPISNFVQVGDSAIPQPSFTTSTHYTIPFESLRDERGLLKGIDYVFDELGKVDWRAMLKREHVAVKKEHAAKYAKDVTIDQIDDRHLLILLPGIKYLAHLRGYTVVKPNVVYVTDNRTVVQTDITWIGNFETDFRFVTFGDVGAAGFNNTDGPIGRNHLETIAANRAFVRTVRNYLGINIVANDEISEQGSKDSQQPASAPVVFDPTGLLKSKVEAGGDTFDSFKAAVAKKYKDVVESDPAAWTSFSEVPISDAYKLLSVVTKREEKSKR